MASALRCSGVDVRFGSVHALKDVSVDYEEGRIHALLGQNGAGKSTIARVMSGVLAPDTGEVEIFGRAVAPGQPAAVQAAGLDIVHQRFSLPPTFQVAEALEFASARKMGGAFFSGRAISESWSVKLSDAGLQVDPQAKLSTLPVETVQAIEILRALSNDARILILDEPTALLSPSAIEELFGQLNGLRDRGVTLIVILHKLKEVMALADTVSILREGSLVLPPTPKKDLSERMISELMVGEVAATGSPAPAGSVGARQAICRFDSVESRSRGSEPGLDSVNFELAKGEILGIAGIEGNGQRSLAEIFAGLRAPTSGAIQLDGADVTTSDVAARRAMGLRAVPFDRMVEGASLTLPLWENIRSWAASAYRYGRWPIVSIGSMQKDTRAALDRFGVVYDTPSQVGGTLSGGNLQRLILARELEGSVTAVLAAQPTRGLDFAATSFVWSELVRVRDSGAGVVMISSDLDELFGICDRILVLRGGAVAGEFKPPFSAASVGAAMVGAGE